MLFIESTTFYTFGSFEEKMTPFLVSHIFQSVRMSNLYQTLPFLVQHDEVILTWFVQLH